VCECLGVCECACVCVCVCGLDNCVSINCRTYSALFPVHANSAVSLKEEERDTHSSDYVFVSVSVSVDSQTRGRKRISQNGKFNVSIVKVAFQEI